MVKFLFCICSYKPEHRKCQLMVPFSFYPNFPTSKEGTINQGFMYKKCRSSSIWLSHFVYIRLEHFVEKPNGKY